MKKILILLSALFVSAVLGSCVQPFDYTKLDYTLAVYNTDLPLSASGGGAADTESYCHRGQIVSSGEWEATLELADQDLAWCWLGDYYRHKVGTDVETGMSIYENVKIEGLTITGSFEHSPDKPNKVRGKAGSTYLPIYYTSTINSRYAVLTVRNLESGEVKVMRINQK